MKKIILFAAISLFSASSAFAAGSLTLSVTSTGKSIYGVKTGTATATSPLIGKTSTGVGVGLKLDTTAGTGYAVETQHKNGSKAYGSAFDSTSIYVKDVTVGTADTTTLTTGVDSFVGQTGWTSM